MEITSDAYRAKGLWQFFSFEGRIRRMTFWINALLCTAIQVVTYLIFVDIFVSASTLESSVAISNKPIYYLIMLIIAVRTISIHVRRWHDLDKSGWWALTGIVPALTTLNPSGFGLFVGFVGAIVALYALGMCGFVPGDQGANTYGPEPEEGQWL